ncbi:MAG: malate dehydrogenase [Bacteroidales bacterium]|jgi:malate dehydrogenase|nr:malate dehydrogenase [Bacteroidales bacterium]
MKVTVVGAGNVGTTCAQIIAGKNIVREVVLLDIKEGMPEGKSLDLWQTAPINFFDTRLTSSTNNYKKTENSEVVVITSGVTRKPGMNRDDLISINAGIIKNVTEKVIKHSPNAKIIIVSNPLEVMTYTAFKSAGKPRNEVIGMSGLLNTARFRAFLAEELDVSPRDIQSLIIGGHGDTMVLLSRYTTISGIPVKELLSEKKLNSIIKRTKKGGGELVNLMGTSAWYAPGSAVAQMVEAIIMDQKRIMPCCVKLEGEYGYSDLFMGVPVKLGKNGIEQIIEISLNKKERKALDYSAESIGILMKILDRLQI